MIIISLIPVFVGTYVLGMQAMGVTPFANKHNGTKVNSPSVDAEAFLLPQINIHSPPDLGYIEAHESLEFYQAEYSQASRAVSLHTTQKDPSPCLTRTLIRAKRTATLPALRPQLHA